MIEYLGLSEHPVQYRVTYSHGDGFVNIESNIEGDVFALNNKQGAIIFIDPYTSVMSEMEVLFPRKSEFWLETVNPIIQGVPKLKVNGSISLIEIRLSDQRIFIRFTNRQGNHSIECGNIIFVFSDRILVGLVISSFSIEEY